MTRRARVEVWPSLDLATGAMTVDTLLTQILDVERVVKLLCLETDLAPEQIGVASQTSVRVLLLPLMMAIRAALGPKPKHLSRRLLFVSPMAGRALKARRDVRLMHKVDVEDSAGLGFDAAMTLEARAFERRFRPLLRESSKAALLQRLIDHIVTCIEERQAVFDVVRADASIDELNVRVSIRQRPFFMRSRERVASLHPFGLCFFQPVADQALPAREHLLVARPVTRHAAHLICLCHLAPEFVLREEVTAVAMDARLKHSAGHRLDAFASDAGIQVGRGRMAIPVAGTAVVRGRCHGVDRFMLNLNVAIRALDLMIGHVSLMHELGLAVTIQPWRIVVASVAALARNFAGSLDHVRVAR